MPPCVCESPQHEIVKCALNKVAMKRKMTGWYQQWVGKTEGTAQADSGGHDKENWLGKEEKEMGGGEDAKV